MKRPVTGAVPHGKPDGPSKNAGGGGATPTKADVGKSMYASFGERGAGGGEGWERGRVWWVYARARMCVVVLACLPDCCQMIPANQLITAAVVGYCRALSDCAAVSCSVPCSLWGTVTRSSRSPSLLHPKHTNLLAAAIAVRRTKNQPVATGRNACHMMQTAVTAACGCVYCAAR